MNEINELDEIIDIEIYAKKDQVPRQDRRHALRHR